MATTHVDIGTTDRPIECTIGDTLFLSGTLTGSNLPPDAYWVGATGALFVTKDDTGAVVVNGTALDAFDTSTCDVAIAVAVPALVGDYTARVRVTFTSGKKLSFPNGAKKIKIRVVK